MIHKTTRSILSVLLAALLLVTSIPLTPAFADGGGVSLQSANNESRELEQDGDGTYLIYTAENLKEFAVIVNGTDSISADSDADAKLMNDIDLNGSEENPWTPIGNSESTAYTGTFDGNGKTISGLYIDSRANYQGLFGYVGSEGTVQNLTVTGSVTSNVTESKVGGVVGYNGGTVENCYNTGKVSAPDSGNSGNNFVGGVVGGNNGGTVENCCNIGEVSGRYVGGVVGYSSGSSSSASVTNCYNTGEVSGGEDVGGVVGNNSFNAHVTNCYNTGNVSGPDSVNGETIVNVGGVVGYNSFSVTVTNCYNTGTVTGSGDRSNVGGVVGDNSSSVTNCYFLQQDPEIPGIGNDDSADATPVDNLDELCEALEDSDTWTIHPVLGRPVLNENWEGGLGTEASPYEISTADELKNFATAVNGKDGNPNAHAKLMNNIDLEGSETNQWTPIGNSSKPYSGTFNGQNFKISGLYINDSTANYQGLFGYLSTDGDNTGTVQNLTVSGTVSGGMHVGGIVGQNNGSVKNCYNTGAVSGSGWYVGGVVGDNSGTVENCYNTGTVTGTDDYVGGVVGYNSSSTVENCHNIGAVSGNNFVGGVVGDNGGSVKNCYNTGEVSGPNSGTSNYVGGVVGNNISSVTNCYFLQTADVNENLSGIGSGTGTATEKDDTAFHSGEVAWLLQKGQTAGEGGVVPLVWGQSKLGETTSLPTLNPTDEQKVYQVTFDYGDSFTETDDRYDYRYANANDNVTLPTSTDPIPSYEGHTLTGWQDESGQTVQGESVTITADTEFTAQWTKDTVNYTVTVSADPEAGGTVSGGGTFTENSKVTVTATPATGYHFVNWTENGTEVSTEATFTFNATVDRNLIAIFAKNEEPDPTPTPTPDPTPSGPSTGDSTGWDDIRDELENAEKGDEITIDMGDETKVPAEIFESLAGKDVDVTFDLGDIQWSVNGADIPTDTDFTDLDLGVSLATSGIPVNVINTITGEVGTVQITLAHDGDFGFTMTLTAPLGVENSGYWANLYHYDEADEQLTFETAAEIDADGSVSLSLSHASQYAIVIDTHSHAAVDVSDLFSDIAPDAWYKDAIQYAYDNGLMTGVSATEFAPEQTTTRAMIVSILARLENVTTAEAAGFADVDDNDWYATAVNWAANVGVVNGYEDNTFRPNTAITREQLAAILMNYAAYKGEDVSNRADLTSYTDQPSTWAEETMQWAVAEGLISGVTADTLQPQGAATRAQVAAILQRFLSE